MHKQFCQLNMHLHAKKTGRGVDLGVFAVVLLLLR